MENIDKNREVLLCVESFNWNSGTDLSDLQPWWRSMLLTQVVNLRFRLTTYQCEPFPVIDKTVLLNSTVTSTRRMRISR